MVKWARSYLFTPPPPQGGGLDLDKRSSGCARLGGGVGPPLGVVVEGYFGAATPARGLVTSICEHISLVCIAYTPLAMAIIRPRRKALGPSVVNETRL